MKTLTMKVLIMLEISFNKNSGSLVCEMLHGASNTDVLNVERMQHSHYNLNWAFFEEKSGWDLILFRTLELITLARLKLNFYERP